jgi:DNA-binding MarR family transcriptional regulator
VIEFDNEFEHLTPHRTTNHGSATASDSAPWLVSMAMWTTFLRIVPDEGVSVADFQRETRLPGKQLKVWLIRLSQWWGYVTVQKTATQSASDWMIVPTPGGRKALQVWRPMTGIIEQRWEQRFGKDMIDGLRQSLRAVVQQFDTNLPDYLPILGYDMLSRVPNLPARTQQDDTGLPFLLAKTLLAFASEYENEAHLSLAISANILRLAEKEVRLSDLPRMSGVSKEAVAMAVKRLQEKGLADVRVRTGSRLKVLSLTDKGQQARTTYRRLVREIEERWQAAFGPCVIDLRSRIESILPSLAEGVKPYADGWRASVPRPEALPHFPMILHRGGFPDGS